MVVLAVLSILTWLTPASAEWYLAGDLLQARYQEPQVDGSWRQDRLPSKDGIQANQFTTQALAWGAGLGYRFTDGEAWYRQRWSLESGYRDWGFISTGGLYVSDADYARIQTANASDWLEKHNIDPKRYEVADHYQGGYIRAAKGFPLPYGFEPYVSIGWFVAQHQTRLAHLQNQVFESGMVAGPTVGGGVKVELYQGIKARVGIESHWTILETHNPVSSHWLTVGAGIEVPLSLFNMAGGTTRNYLWQR